MILVAIGSNLPDADGTSSLDLCRRAVAALRHIDGLHLSQVSPWYETAPMPPSDQPRYVNGVARLDGEADPADLLRRLHAIEHQAGRSRGIANAARTLDLDLIELNGIVRAAPDPVLPHPRAHLRAFVLVPLRRVAPEWRHPVLGADAAALLGLLPPQDVVPLTLLGQDD